MVEDFTLIETFRLFDTDFDGSLSSREVDQGVLSCGVYLTQDELDSLKSEVINTAESKNSVACANSFWLMERYKFSLEQFSAIVMKAKSLRLLSDPIEKCFSENDLDQDGTIDTSEFAAVLRACSQSLTAEDIQSIIQIADPHKKGKANYQLLMQTLLAA